jgi:hypothetical protein
MTKYKTTNINTKGNMPCKEDIRSLPAAAAGAVWAKAEEINTVRLQIKGLLPGYKTPQQANRELYAAALSP